MAFGCGLNLNVIYLIVYGRQHEEYLRRTLDYSEDSTQPASANSSVSEGPVSPLVLESNVQALDMDANHLQEVESLKRLLQEVYTFERDRSIRIINSTLATKTKCKCPATTLYLTTNGLCVVYARVDAAQSGKKCKCTD